MRSINQSEPESNSVDIYRSIAYPHPENIIIENHLINVEHIPTENRQNLEHDLIILDELALTDLSKVLPRSCATSQEIEILETLSQKICMDNNKKMIKFHIGIRNTDGKFYIIFKPTECFFREGCHKPMKMYAIVAYDITTVRCFHSECCGHYRETNTKSCLESYNFITLFPLENNQYEIDNTSKNVIDSPTLFTQTVEGQNSNLPKDTPIINSEPSNQCISWIPEASRKRWERIMAMCDNDDIEYEKKHKSKKLKDNIKMKTKNSLD
ncbi:hypothetical protein RF11_09834 [Thelohanellus kitauei]|uniref:Uncharacterized protein n=1 Tax=Thelohanellus kitauei TaxID=669202 RepID=A0A0C2N0U0_THEKT|nr:hypothetical protein RF11_09834 [Thelohanellus kitauei]